MGTNHEFQEVAALFRTGKIGAVVDKVYKPEEAGEAWGTLEGEGQFGKVVIDWREGGGGRDALSRRASR